jgi:hypothetical protein
MAKRCKESPFVGKESRFFTTHFSGHITLSYRGDDSYSKKQLRAPIIPAIFVSIFAQRFIFNALEQFATFATGH